MHIRFLILAVLLLGHVASTSAAVRHWDGGGTTGFWDTAANWSNNVAPVNGDALFFPTNVARLVNTNRTVGNLTNISTIRFTGDGYNVFSVPFINLTNGLTNAGLAGSANTINAGFTLRGNQTWSVGGRNTLTANSNVVSSGSVMTNDIDGSLIMNGVFSGGVGAQIIKLGTGRLELNGATNSVPTVRVLDGTLQVGGALVATSLAISNGASLVGTGSVTAFTCAGDFSPAGTSTPGLLTMTGAGNAIFATGARFFVTLNGLEPGIDYDQFKTPSVPNFSGAQLVVVRSFSFPFGIGQKFVIVTNTGVSAQSTTFTNLPQNAFITNSSVVFQISYTGGSGNDVELTVVDAPFVATGVTRLWDGGGVTGSFSNPVNWVGDVVPVDGDSIQFPTSLSAPDNLATNDLAIRFNQLLCASNGAGFTLRGNPLLLAGGIIATQASGALTVFNNVSFVGPATIETAATNVVLRGFVDNGGTDLMITGGSGRVDIHGVLSGGGGLVVNNVGGALLENGNTYTGTTRLLRGPVTVGAPGSLGGSTNGTFVAEGTLLTVTSTRLFENSISLTGRMFFAATIVSNVTSALEFTGTNTSIQAGPTATVSFFGPWTGNGTVQLDQGEFVLASTHAVASGIKLANRGRLRINGPGASDITLGFAGGTLSGTGTVGRISISVSPLGLGRIEPGNGPGPGILTTSNLLFGGTLTNAFELNGLTPGTGHDQLRVQGTVNLGGARLELSLGFAPSLNDTFTILDNDGADAVTGTYAGLPEAAIIASGASAFRISYVGGDGNDVTLTAVDAPFIATGVTRVWNGGGGSGSPFWSVPANWDGNILPARGDNLVFPASAPSNTRINTQNLALTNASYNRIWFGGEGNTWIIQGNTLKIFDGVVATNESGLGHAAFGNSAVELLGPQTWSTTNCNLSVNAPLFLREHTLTLASGSGGRVFLQNSIFGPGAVVMADGDVSIFAQLGISGAPVTIQGARVIASEGFHAGPVWQMSSGLLRLGNTLIPGLQMTGGTLDLSPQAGATNAGDITLAAACTVLAQFGTTLNPPPSLIVTGQVNLAGAALVAGPADLSLLNIPIVLIEKTSVGPITGTFAGLAEGGLLQATNELDGLVTDLRVSYVGGDGNDVTLTQLGARTPDELVWDGGAANPLWSDALNWEGDLGPIAGDTLLFPGHVPGNERTNQNNFPAGQFFERLIFGGSNWTVNGNSIRLRNGIEVTNRVGGSGVTVNLGIALTTNQTWIAGSNSLSMNGAIDVGTNTMTVQVASANAINLQGAISGAGRIIKRGAGDMTVSPDNEFTGALRIESGLAITSARQTIGAPWELVGGQLRLLGTIPGLNASSGTLMIPFIGNPNIAVAGNLVLSAGVTFDLSGGSATLSVTGTVNLANARLIGVPSNPNYAPFGPSEVILIRNDGNDPVVGTFFGLPEGAVLSGSGSGSNFITYVGGDGNDVAVRSTPLTFGGTPRVWDGGGTNGAWSTTTNWNPDVAPSLGVSVQFPVTAARKQHHVNNSTSLSRFFIDSMFFEGSDYVITNAPPASALGVIELSGGIFATNTSGTNALSAIVGVWTDQTWRVQSSNAVFRFGGVATGYGVANKDGAGLMEMTGALLTNQLRYVNRAGPSRFLDTAAERIAVAGGKLDMTGGGALQLTATGGVTRLARTYVASLTATTGQVEFASGPLTGGTTNGACAITNLTLGPGAQIVVDVAVSNSTAILLLGPMAISNATLDVRVTGPLRAGEIIAVATPFPSGLEFPFPAPFAAPTNTPAPVVVNGTFSGLPDGAEATFSGRQFRIHYSRTNGPTVLPGVYLTALASTPVLTRIVVLESGVIEIEGDTDPFTQVTLEGSNDFVQWTTLGDAVSGSNGHFQLTDVPGLAVPHRFYRARTQ